MNNSKVASRYAKALFTLAVEKNAVEAFNDDLQAIVELLANEEQLKTIFFHPRLSREEKNGIVDEVFAVILENEFVVNFVRLAIAKKRERDIPAIVGAWQLFYDDYKQQLPVEVVVATELDDDQLQQLLADVALRTGRQPIPQVIVDPAIIGGVILRYQDKIIDGSVRNQLQQLAASIKAIPIAGLRGEKYEN